MTETTLKGFVDRNGIKRLLPVYDDTEVRSLIAEKAPLNHNHDDEYAAKEHNHDEDYATKAQVLDASIKIEKEVEGVGRAKVECNGDYITLFVANDEGEDPVEKEIELNIQNMDKLSRALNPDTQPVANSPKPITSGAVSSALADKMERATEEVYITNTSGTLGFNAEDSADVFAMGRLMKTIPVYVNVYDEANDEYKSFFGISLLRDAGTLLIVSLYIGEVAIIMEKSKASGDITVDNYTLNSLLA